MYQGYWMLNKKVLPVGHHISGSYGRYFFKGSTEEIKEGEIQAAAKEEEAEPQNYSFLDLLIPEGKREER